MREISWHVCTHKKKVKTALLGGLVAVEHVLQLGQCFLEMKPTTALPAGELHSEHSDHLPIESETIDIALIIIIS